MQKNKNDQRVPNAQLAWQSALDAMGVTVWVPRREPETEPISMLTVQTTLESDASLSIHLLQDPPLHPILVVVGTEQQMCAQSPRVKQLLDNILRVFFQSTAPLAHAVTVLEQGEEIIPLTEQLTTLQPLACLVFGDCLPPLMGQAFPVIYLPSLESCLSDPAQKRMIWQQLASWLERWRIEHPEWSQ
jgi:hypothetical protein